VLAQAPNLPLHLLVMCSYVIASSTQRHADMLGVLPWHPCSSIHVSDTSRWPLLTQRGASCTRALGTACACTYSVCISAFRSHARSRPQHSRAVFRRHSAAARNPCASNPSSPPNHRHGVHACIGGGVQSTFQRSPYELLLTWPAHFLLSPRTSLPVRALGAAPSRPCAYPVVFARAEYLSAYHV
jgi:hypothetical protein